LSEYVCEVFTETGSGLVVVPVDDDGADVDDGAGVDADAEELDAVDGSWSWLAWETGDSVGSSALAG
jgi:hypothetical protein